MTPYSKFERVHKKIAIFQEIRNYLHSSQNVTNFNHKKIGLWMLILDEIYFCHDNYVHSTCLANLDENIS